MVILSVQTHLHQISSYNELNLNLRLTCLATICCLPLLTRHALPATCQYAHMDFVWDRNAVYKKDMVDLLYRFNPDTF